MVHPVTAVLRRAGRLGWLLLWPVRSVRRVLVLAWLTGFGIVGAAQMAMADTVNNIVTGPDLAGGASQTVFERVPWDAYTLPFNISKAAAGTAGVGEAWWMMLNGIADAALFLAGAVVRGGIYAIEWVLQLTGLYSTQAGIIDGAVQTVASAVFWPLFAATIAAGAMVLYAKGKQNGRGSILGDVVQFLVIGVVAVSFIAAPSRIISTVDDARTAVTDAGMVGYSNATATPDSAAGFPAVAVPATSTGAVRRLADGLWNVYFVMPWCFSAFGEDLSLCKSVGSDYLTQSPRWAQIDQSQTDRKGGNSAPCSANDANGNPAIDAYLACQDKAWCADEVQSKCEWVRGQSYARIGAVLLALLISIPLALLLLALAFFGTLAVVGFMLLLLMAPLFILPALIPGMPRRISVRYVEHLLGMFLQSVVITFVIGAVMVLSSIFALMVPTVGLLFVAVLNVAALMMAFKLRAVFDNLTGLTNPAHGFMSSYMAMKTLGALGRMSKGAVRGAAKSSAAGSQVAAKGAMVGASVARSAPARTAQLRQHFAPTPFMPQAAAFGPTMAAGQQTSGPRAITAQGQYSMPHTPRPAGFPHSEPKVDQGARNWGGTGKPGDVPSPGNARMRVDPDQSFRPSRRGQTVPGAPPMQQSVNVPRRHDPLAITRQAKPVTPRAQLPGPRPVRPPQSSGPRQTRSPQVPPGWSAVAGSPAPPGPYRPPKPWIPPWEKGGKS